MPTEPAPGSSIGLAVEPVCRASRSSSNSAPPTVIACNAGWPGTRRIIDTGAPTSVRHSTSPVFGCAAVTRTDAVPRSRRAWINVSSINNGSPMNVSNSFSDHCRTIRPVLICKSYRPMRLPVINIADRSTAIWVDVGVS